MMEFKMKENAFQAEFAYGSLDISGDETDGFRPFQLLVSSIAVCSGGVLRKVLQKMRIPYEDVHIQAKVERNPDKADRIEKIDLHFAITGKDLPEAKVARAMALTRKNCAMVQSVADSIEITERFTLIEPTTS